MTLPRRSMIRILVLGLVLLGAGRATGQCILANPSFEIDGSDGEVLAGWNHFGVVSTTALADHGLQAALATGPDTGAWDVSGYWQARDCCGGERFTITGHVLNPSSNPLTGQNSALVNIEWRDRAGELLDYDSFPVADSSTPLDEYLEFTLTSSPAPDSTVSTRLLLGVQQGPLAAASSACFDQVTLESTTLPTIDWLQWNDFPGERTLEFGGYTWRVKGPGYFGPASNLFIDYPVYVGVDENGELHLTLTRVRDLWYATEIATAQPLGYGDYILTTRGRLDLLDEQAVLGIFLWEYGPCWDAAYGWWNPYNEIDIEYSRWLDPGAQLAQFVAQPYDWAGNLERFDAAFADDEIVSHAMRWTSDRVEYRVWRGGPDEEATSPLVHSWTYTGPHVPRPERPRLHLNLWRIDGEPAADQRVVFTDFRFVPENGPTPVGDEGEILPPSRSARLYPAAPNPFNPRTTVRFELSTEQHVTLEICDLGGRRVRTLVEGRRTAGEHHATWDGCDATGRRLASGVYLLRLAGRHLVETQRIVLLK